MKIFKTIAFACLVSTSVNTAYAFTCAGVEARVNVKTSALSTTVTALIQSRQTQLIAQERLARERLLSAIKVLTKQMSTSNEQEVVADRSSQLALSNVMVEQSVNTQMRHAVQDYSNTGFNACGIVAKGRTVAQMMNAYDSSRKQMAERVRKGRSAKTMDEFRSMMGKWTQRVQSANEATIASVLNGDKSQAEAFIAVVAGPPRPPIQGKAGSVAAKQDRVIAMQEEARNSAAVLVLSDIAASQRLQTALDDMTSQWVGDDGGAKWAAKMAASPTRAVLLDTARIEAQTIASTALELRRSVMEEFALSTFALSYVDRMRQREMANATQVSNQ